MERAPGDSFAMAGAGVSVNSKMGRRDVGGAGSWIQYAAFIQGLGDNTYDSQAELASDKIRLDSVMNQASMPLQEWVSNDEYFNILYQLAEPITQNVLGNIMEPYTDNMNEHSDWGKVNSRRLMEIHQT